MYLDRSLLLCDNIITTTSGASTDYIDTLAAGNDINDAFFVVKVESTAFTAQIGAPLINFELQTSYDTNFTANSAAICFTLCAANKFLVGALTANTIVARIPIPPGSLRYIRGYMDNTNFAAGTIMIALASYSMFITRDVDALISGRQ